MQALVEVVMAAVERHDLASVPEPGLLPEIEVHELRLRPADLRRMVEAFKAAVPGGEEQVSGSGDTYTVSLIVAPGRLSDHL